MSDRLFQNKTWDPANLNRYRDRGTDRIILYENSNFSRNNMITTKQ